MVVVEGITISDDDEGRRSARPLPLFALDLACVLLLFTRCRGLLAARCCNKEGAPPSLLATTPCCDRSGLPSLSHPRPGMPARGKREGGVGTSCLRSPRGQRLMIQEGEPRRPRREESERRGEERRTVSLSSRLRLVIVFALPQASLAEQRRRFTHTHTHPPQSPLDARETLVGVRRNSQSSRMESGGLGGCGGRDYNQRRRRRKEKRSPFAFVCA